MPPSLKETNPAPPYNTPTASASGAARHQPANMTRPARHARGLSFCASPEKAALANRFFTLCISGKRIPPLALAPPPSRLSVPRGKPRKDPRRYRRKRKLSHPKRLPPKAATRRGKCGAGAGASLRASALPCVSPPPATPSAGRVILGQAARLFCGLPPRTNTLLQPSGGRA